MSRQKMEYTEWNVVQGNDLFLQHPNLPKPDSFKYIGSYVTKGVLCNNKINAKVK